MNHRAPRRGFAIWRASGSGGRRVAPRGASRPGVRLAAAAGCALVSTTATLVSANELRKNFDGVLDVTLHSGATADSAPAARATHDAEPHPVGSSARSRTVDLRTPVRTSPHMAPSGSGTAAEGDSVSPAAPAPSAEPRRADSIETTDDTDAIAETSEPNDTAADQGDNHGWNDTAAPQQHPDDGSDGSDGSAGQHNDQSTDDDSAAGPSGDAENSEPQDHGGHNGDPENDGAGRSDHRHGNSAGSHGEGNAGRDRGQGNSERSGAARGGPHGGDDGRGDSQRSGAQGSEPQNMTGEASHSAPTSGPAAPSSWMEAAFTRALTWGP